MSQSDALRLAIDIGGTFTDTVLIAGGETILATDKTLTTPGDPTEGALEGARRALATAGRSTADVTGFIHGTTLATNALIERRGARVATITTEGFRDILEIAYERRYSQYDIDLEKPDLIVPRSRCFTVPERLSAKGDIIETLDDAAIDGLIRSLEECEANAVAICLLHAYANPIHERRLRDLLHARRPDLTISLSSDVSPEAREFDRLCTTIANAYIQPLMGTYLSAFDQAFSAAGLACPILLMTAGGGMTSLETAARFPIRLVESGPAGGAILAARIARQTGENAVLSFDMGGTTAKLCLIDDYRPQTARRFEIARAERFIKGSGMPVRIPVVELIEIGAGGGSIAAVDTLGRLTVGPESAGSEPGPAAFQRGGKNPTVTDADVVLGLISPETFAEGRLTLDRTAADKALAETVGRPLDLDGTGAADGVSRIVDEAMASAARMHAVESGKDLGARTMIAFGGNGPLHATRVARRAGVRHVIVPEAPGVGSAVGFLFAPVAFEIVRSLYTMLDTLDTERVNRLLETMVAEAGNAVETGAPGVRQIETRSAFMRYAGQGHEIEITLPSRPLIDGDRSDMLTAFETEYRRQFARPVPGMDVEILNWSVRVTTPDKAIEALSAPTRIRTVSGKGHRTILCDVSGEKVAADLVPRSALQPGDGIDGPALILEDQTTTFVSADFEMIVDDDRNLHLIRHDGKSGDRP